ncbi:PROTEIN PHOSPHATASE 1 REGULATORY SUBUNIT [Salix viminalis]|uniref:PROTEIN PHOSPHATASE 1 REGULATORY SUBUNIT n=1 Tax=Salix viminalis TaxID=40686 RepID=A0A9Q0U6G7_SALVM|nr:PROTEIN PHOSPHATASE 1 REGULATORY SUBUNIT [Salix viminalis]
MYGHANVIKRIIHSCPDSRELLDLNGRSVLHFAVLSGEMNVVRCVLEIAELQCLVNQADNGGNTPLHLAAIERQTRILRWLIWDERVDHRARNENGQSVFDIDESIRETCFTYRCNIITCMWRKLPSVSNLITGKKNPPCADQEAIARIQTYKQMGNTLLLVATLIATVTFAAAFTMPGGFNNDRGPMQGVALITGVKQTSEMVYFLGRDCHDQLHNCSMRNILGSCY